MENKDKNKRVVKSKPIYAICLVLEGGVHDFTGRTFENLRDAQEYLKNRKETLQAQIDAGALENTLKLESLKHFEIVTGTLQLADDDHPEDCIYQCLIKN